MKKNNLKNAIFRVLLVLSFVFIVTGYSVYAEDLKNGSEKTTTLNNGCGNAEILAVRVGFKDYPLSEEPSDKHITTDDIKGYFAGSTSQSYPYESLPDYYKRASYGQLSLKLGEIIDVELPENRATYSGKSGQENEYRLISDIISQPGVEEKLSDYDADGDGSPDFVYFFCNGDKEDRGSVWWPHCHTENDEYFLKKGSVLKNYVLSCKEQVNVLIHETGHLLRLPDYYSYNDYQTYDFSVPDMMSDNYGDHTGLSKWIAGWITDANIIFADRNNTDHNGRTVNLTPLDEDVLNGKKIAVIATEKPGIYGEYFIVEYISGSGNMSLFDGKRDYPEGFRIVHVYYNSNNGRIYAHALTKDNTPGADFGVFKEGDSITPFTDPSSDFMENGSPKMFTGINITGFVTGKNPSFHVSFSDEEKIQDPVSFEQDDDRLTNMLELTLNSDRPLIHVNKNYGEQYVRLEREGVIYPLVLKGDEYNATKFYLEYRELTSPLLPVSDYTLVLPEGTFTTEDGDVIPEIRKKITTGDFTRLNNIETVDPEKFSSMRTGLVSYKDSSAYVTLTGHETTDGLGFRFVKFNSEDSMTEEEFYMNIPEDKRFVEAVNIIKTYDGQYLLYVNTLKNTYAQKITESGEKITNVLMIPEVVSIIELENGFKGLSAWSSGSVNAELISGNGEFTGDIWSFDFTGEPVRKIYKYDAYISGGFLAIDREHYCISGYDKGSERYYTDIYDSKDNFEKRVLLSGNLPLSICAYDSKITVVEIAFDEETGAEHFVIYTYDTLSDSVVNKKLEGDKLDEIYLSGIKLQKAEYGYVLFYRYSGKTDIALSRLMFLSDDYDIVGSLTLPGGADCIPQKDRIVVVWEDNEGRSMAWTEVFMTGKEEDKERPVNHRDSVSDKRKNDIDGSEIYSYGNAGINERTEKHRIKDGENMKSSPSQVYSSETGTGDELWLWVMIMAGSLAGCTAVAIYWFKIRLKKNGE